jgi:hypothetical protein
MLVVSEERPINLNGRGGHGVPAVVLISAMAEPPGRFDAKFVLPENS